MTGHHMAATRASFPPLAASSLRPGDDEAAVIACEARKISLACREPDIQHLEYGPQLGAHPSGGSPGAATRRRSGGRGRPPFAWRAAHDPADLGHGQVPLRSAPLSGLLALAPHGTTPMV